MPRFSFFHFFSGKCRVGLATRDEPMIYPRRTHDYPVTTRDISKKTRDFRGKPRNVQPVIYPWQTRDLPVTTRDFFTGSNVPPIHWKFLGNLCLMTIYNIHSGHPKRESFSKFRLWIEKGMGGKTRVFGKNRVFSTKPGFPERTSVLLANPGYFKGLEAQGMYMYMYMYMYILYLMSFFQRVEIMSFFPDQHWINITPGPAAASLFVSPAGFHGVGSNTRPREVVAKFKKHDVVLAAKQTSSIFDKPSQKWKKISPKPEKKPVYVLGGQISKKIKGHLSWSCLPKSFAKTRKWSTWFDVPVLQKKSLSESGTGYSACLLPESHQIQ